LNKVVVFLAFVALVASVPKRFDGYQVIGIESLDAAQRNALQKLDEDTEFDIDFWSRPTSRTARVQIAVSPESWDKFKEYLDKLGISFVVDIKDLQSLISQEKGFGYAGFSVNKFNRYNDIVNWMQSLSKSSSYKGLCSTFSIGQTIEGRTMTGIKLGTSRNPKGAIWLDGGIHAREWASPATMVQTIHKLVNAYATDYDVRNILDAMDVYILPVHNPDGYEYSHTSYRMWRKNRRRFSGTSCVGTDLNRNFGHHWNEVGTSQSKCSDIYSGAGPFSEPETKNVRDFILSKKGLWKGFLTFHAYGQYFFTPWGYTRSLPSDYSAMKTVADEASAAIRSYRGTRYSVGSSTNLLYSAAGGSEDWTKAVAGIKYSYCLELPDKGYNGFILPERDIPAVGEETYRGIKAFMKRMNTIY